MEARSERAALSSLGSFARVPTSVPCGARSGASAAVMVAWHTQTFEGHVAGLGGT